MGRPRVSVPRYRRQRHPSDPSRDRAFVEVNGQRTYLGPYDSPESRAAYSRFLAEAGAGVTPLAKAPLDPQGFTVVELVDRYQTYLETAVQKPKNYDSALTPLTELYGFCRVAEFGSQHLIAVQHLMAQRDWSAKYVNKNIGRIRRMFKWGVPRKLVSPTVHAELALVENLRPSDDEDRSVKPAPLADVERVKAKVSRQIAAMIDLQLLTGARPGEVCAMRPIDIDTTDPNVWVYRPQKHKNQHRGKKRLIYLGPKAQAVVKPFLADRRVDAYLFSPAEADAERRAKLHATRRTPMSCGNSPGTNRRDAPKSAPKERYTTVTYAQAVRRACRKWGVLLWSPNQLRHTFATMVRAQHGLDVASTLLGHSKVETTQIYAEQNFARARDVARSIG